MIKKIIFLITVIVMLFLNCAFAVDTYGGYDVPVDIDVNGSFIKCAQKPIMINSTTYIPLRAFSDAIGGEISWNGEEKTATMTKDGHSFMFYTGKDFCVIDGEEENHPSVIYKDLTFIPVRAVSEVLGYDVLWDDFYLTVKITAPGIEVSEDYKDKSYTYEDLLYLAKITYIESGYEDFQVQLGVAGTVVNRVKSPLAPNTVKEVVLDTRYGVQFPPAHTDKINVTPSKKSMISGKCAFNGVNLVGNCLYFIDKKSAPYSWVHKNKSLYKTIYSMNFYE